MSLPSLKGEFDAIVKEELERWLFTELRLDYADRVGYHVRFGREYTAHGMVYFPLGTVQTELQFSALKVRAMVRQVLADLTFLASVAAGRVGPNEVEYSRANPPNWVADEDEHDYELT